MSDVIHPEIEVELIGTDGNAFAILAKVESTMEDRGLTPDEIQKFHDEATEGDYNNLLRVIMRWVVVV